MDKATFAIQYGDSRRQLIQQVQRLCSKGGTGDWHCTSLVQKGRECPDRVRSIAPAARPPERQFNYVD